MICKFCGNLIEDNSDYCFICGQKAEPAVEEAPAENMFAEAAEEAPAYVEAAYAQEPVYAQAPIYVQTPVYVQAPVAAAPAEKKVKDKSIATKAMKFFAAFFAATFVLQFISWIWVKKAKKEGYDQKAADLTNSTMVGLCVFMGLASLFIIFKYMIM